MRWLILSIAFILVHSKMHTQFSDSLTHYFRLAATGNINRSNNNTAYLFANEARYSVRKKLTTLNTAANWLYGAQRSLLTNNDFTTTADLNRYRDSSNLYYWALANFTSSFSLKIKSQLQSGVGVAYNFVNTPKAWVNLSEGILYETSHLDATEPADNRYHTLRHSLRFSYKIVFATTFTLSGGNFFQQAIGNGGDYILRATNAFNVKLNQWISIGSTVTYNQFRRTAAENLLFTYGIVAEKYF